MPVRMRGHPYRDRAALPRGAPPSFVGPQLVSAVAEKRREPVSAAMIGDQDGDHPSLGPCCMCGAELVRTILMLHQDGPAKMRVFGDFNPDRASSSRMA